MQLSDIIYEKKNGVAKITINRPEKRNALRFQTWTELHQALIDAERDKTVGVVVLTGAGDKAFAAGADQNEPETPQYRRLCESVMRAITNASKPVIAMVNGYAIGGGHWLHYLCDFTVASENAIFGQTGPRVGSLPAGWNISYLAWVVGEKRAREIWMLCRQYNAQQALEMGLVNKVVPLDKLQEEVDKWCQELLALSPTCLKAVKASYNMAVQLLHVANPIEEIISAGFYDTDESKEGVRAFLEKRAPDFNQFRR